MAFTNINNNPYPIVGTDFQLGMSSVITYLAALGTFPNVATNDLADAVYQYIQPTFYPGISPIMKIELTSVIYSSINSYINGDVTGIDSSLYNESQNSFVDLMIGASFTNYITVDAVPNRIKDIDDNITKSDLPVEDQTPLLLATQIGSSAYVYLLTQINTVGTAWAPYFTGVSAALAGPLPNLPFWVAASMEGALIGANSTTRGMIQTEGEYISVQIISALTAALTITAGKIIFRWSQRIQRDELKTKLTLNRETISSLNGGITAAEKLGTQKSWPWHCSGRVPASKVVRTTDDNRDDPTHCLPNV